MSKPLELEFVLVSSDYATMNAVSGGVKKYGAKFILVPTAEAARDCLNRRKIDGVFVDLEVSGALGVVESIRKGTSNSKAVIFACVAHAGEYTDALSAGANFLLRKPLNEDSIALHITIAKELLERERRRYFRHAVNRPADLSRDGARASRVLAYHAGATWNQEQRGGLTARVTETTPKPFPLEIRARDNQDNQLIERWRTAAIWRISSARVMNSSGKRDCIPSERALSGW